MITNISTSVDHSNEQTHAHASLWEDMVSSQLGILNSNTLHIHIRVHMYTLRQLVGINFFQEDCKPNTGEDEVLHSSDERILSL